MDLNGICRTCLLRSDQMCSIFDLKIAKDDLPQIAVIDLFHLFTINILYDDGFPDQICTDCVAEIQQMYSFKLKCKRSELILNRLKEAKLRRVAKINDVWNSSQNRNENFDQNEENTDQSQIECWQQNAKSQDVVNINLKDFGQDHPLSQRNSENSEIDCMSAETPNLIVQSVKLEPELDIVEDENFGDICSPGRLPTDTFDCPDCTFECSTLEDLEKHLAESHIEDTLHANIKKELDCSERAGESSSLAAAYDRRDQFMCRVCSKVLPTESSYEDHMQIHNRIRPFKCELCPNTYRYKTNLKNHIYLSHTNHSELQFDASSLDKAEKQCTICSKVFLCDSGLIIHMRTHTGEKPFKCNICSYDFRYAHSLKTHMSTKHSKHGDNLSDLDTLNKTYIQCEICAKMFKRSDSLARHMSIHTGEKPFKCEICKKTFRVKSYLHTHARIKHSIDMTVKTDTGTSPFKCEVCSKLFWRRMSLIEHIRTHTGERPFKCDLCSRTFLHKKNLKSHLRLKHPVDTPSFM